MYKILFSKQACKDYEKVKTSKLKKQVLHLLETVEQNPFQPPYEKLLGDLEGAYSRRINIQHRLVYTVSEEDKTVYILRMWTHYEN